MMQLEVIPTSPIASSVGEKIDSHLTTASFQEAVESSKFSPEPSLLQTKQFQFLLPLPIRPMLQISHQLHHPPLNMFQGFYVFLLVRDPKLNRLLNVWPHQS